MKFFHPAVILSVLILSGCSGIHPENDKSSAYLPENSPTWADLPENDKSSAYLPENSRTSNPTFGQSRAALEQAGVRGVDNESDSEALRGSFRLTVPLVSYRGRSEGLVLGMHYNARLWIRAGGELYSNLDADLLGAPGWNLGVPKIIGGILIEADGTRHPAKRTVVVGNATEEVEATYVTTDGSQIQYTIRIGLRVQRYREGSGEARYPDGSVVVFKGGSYLPTVFDTRLFATDIVDRNGNVTSIENKHLDPYFSPIPSSIHTITDPVGRQIHFHYDSDFPFLLTAITGPGRGNSTRVLARLTYRKIPKYDVVHASDPTQDWIHDTWVLQGIFFPEDGSGYWFGDPDSYSQYGMLKKVIKQNEMTHTAASLNDLGQLQQGTFVLARSYDFPNAPPATGERRAFPRFKTLTETWAGMTTPPAVTTYTIIESSELESVRTQLPDGSIRRTVSDVQMGVPIIKEREGVQNHSFGTTRFAWETGMDGRKRVASVEDIDSQEAQSKTTRFEYGTQNRLVGVKEYDYVPRAQTTPGPLLRYTRYEYLTSPDHTARGMNALVKRIEIYGSNVLTPIERTDFEYDTVSVVPTPGADRNVLVNLAYRPDLRAYFSANADVIRGNQSRIHRWIDPSVSGNTAKTTTDLKYDAVGNLVSVSDAPPSEQQYIYGVGTQYALPEVFLEGAKTNTPAGSQMKTTLVWDKPSGTLSEIHRPSVGLTTYVYDASHRVEEIRHPTGVRLVSAESDQGFVSTETNYSGSAINGRRRTTMNGLGLPTTMYILQDGNAEEVTNIVYDAMGRPARVSSPRNSSATPQWVELGYDGLGRSVSTRYADGSVEETRFGVGQRPSGVSPTGLGSRLIDAWGRERWLIRDALGKIRQVVEPAANSSGSPALDGRTVTEYTYDPRGLLTSAMSYANQSGSAIASRRFAYDGLGRLIRQYLIERNPSLNESGQPSGTQIWSDIFRYDDRSNLVRHIDPRGVSTLFHYDNDPLNRLQRITVDASQAGSAANPVAPTPERSFEYMQFGDTRRVLSVEVAGLVTETFDYYDSGQPRDIATFFTDTSQIPYIRSYKYSPKGQLLNVSVGALGFAIDPRAAGHLFGANYLYAPGGRLKHAGGTGLAGGLNVDITVQPAGDPEELNYGATGGSLIREVITYDPDRKFLSRHQLNRSTTSILDLHMNFEVVPPEGFGGGTDNRRTGQMTRLTDSLTGAPQLLRYDTLGRLKSLINPGKNLSVGNRLEYTYDRAGNRLTSRALEDPMPCQLPCTLADPPELPAGERDGFAQLAYNPLTNRISTPGFEYDAAGNVTRAPRLDGSALKMQYDGHGHLARVTSDATKEWETYAYNAQGKRVRTENSDGRKDYFVWQGPRVLARFTVPAGSVASAPVLDEANVHMGARLTATVQKNGVGTFVPRFVNETTGGLIFTDPTSTAPGVTERSRPYGTGTTPALPGQSRKFHSYDRSNFGLDYSVYRFYDPETGRFIQPDPLGSKVYQVSNPQSLNLYAFTQDDPINRRDPLGLDGCGEGLNETILPDGSTNCSYPYVGTVFETVIRAKGGDTDWIYRNWVSPAFNTPWISLQAQQDFAALQAQESIDRALRKRLAALIKQQKACSEARGAFLGAIQDYADITSSLEILYQEKDILKIQAGAEAGDVVENMVEQAEDPSLGQGAAAGTARALNIVALNRSFDAKNAQIALTGGQRSRMLNKIKAASEAKDAACSTAL